MPAVNFIKTPSSWSKYGEIYINEKNETVFICYICREIELRFANIFRAYNVTTLWDHIEQEHVEHLQFHEIFNEVNIHKEVQSDSVPIKMESRDEREDSDVYKELNNEPLANVSNADMYTVRADGVIILDSGDEDDQQLCPQGISAPQGVEAPQQSHHPQNGIVIQSITPIQTQGGQSIQHESPQVSNRPSGSQVASGNTPGVRDQRGNMSPEEITRENIPAPQNTRENIPAPQNTRAIILAPQNTRENVLAQQNPRKNIPAQQNPRENIPAQQNPWENIPAQHNPRENIPAQQNSWENIPAQQNARENIPAQKTPRKNIPAQKTPRKNIPAQQNPLGNISSPSPSKKVKVIKKIDTATRESTRLIKCNECGYTMCSDLAYKKHKVELHTIGVNSKIGNKRRCSICLELVLKEEFNQHNKTHPRSHTQNCTRCPKYYIDQDELLRHYVEDHKILEVNTLHSLVTPRSI